jgi:uncharacterized protein (UPF0332 family)
MTPGEARERAVQYLMQSAEESLASARSELAAGRARFAMNRAYYACFYAASGVLLAEGRHFVKHAGLRSAVHKHLVKPGKLSADMGKLYDELFADRHEADYGTFVEFDGATVQDRIDAAERFVEAMKGLL